MTILLALWGWLSSAAGKAITWATANPAWAIAALAVLFAGYEHIHLAHDVKVIKTDTAEIRNYRAQLSTAVADNKTMVNTVDNLKAANVKLATDLAAQTTAAAQARAAMNQANTTLKTALSTAKKITHDKTCTHGSVDANVVCADIAQRLRDLDAALPHAH